LLCTTYLRPGNRYRSKRFAEDHAADVEHGEKNALINEGKMKGTNPNTYASIASSTFHLCAFRNCKAQDIRDDGYVKLHVI
jgi:hypothetical protein